MMILGKLPSADADEAEEEEAAAAAPYAGSIT